MWNEFFDRSGPSGPLKMDFARGPYKSFVSQLPVTLDMSGSLPPLRVYIVLICYSEVLKE